MLNMPLDIYSDWGYIDLNHRLSVAENHIRTKIYMYYGQEKNISCQRE